MRGRQEDASGRGGRRARARALARGAFGLALGSAAACLRIGELACEQDSQCVLDGREGICAEPGFCALPDDACESGYRFHERGVPEALEGECAPATAPGTSEGSDTGEATSEGTGTSGGDTSSGAASSSSSEDGSSSTGSNPCGDHPCPCAADVAAGANHTCVVRTDGDVTCWGTNLQGQMGTGLGSGPTPELKSVTLPGEAVAEAIHSGNDHLCARAGTSLLCWGRNTNDQLVPGGDAVLAPQPIAVEGPAGAVGLAPDHSCVGELGGPTLWCLGNDANEELGGGGAPPVASTLPGMPVVDELALGQNHSCARAGGQVWCWGSDQYGQLGQNMVMGPTATKTEVALPGDAMLLVAGNTHTCAALDGGTAVRCWGHNDNGQIGDGTMTNRQLPNALAEPLPAAVVAMDALIDTTCALLASGELWCWGGRNTRDLGIDIDYDTALRMPQRVSMTDALPEPIVAFALGSRHLCARAGSGRLWCWGRNSSWQVGPDGDVLVEEPVELDLGCPPP